MHIWTLPTVDAEVWIAASHDVPTDKLMSALPAMRAAWRVDDWFGSSSGRDTLLAIGRHLGAPAASGSISSGDALKDRVRRALSDGRLVAYVRNNDVHAIAVPVEVESKQAAAPAKRDETTWVAVQLVDDDGKPVPYKRYRITLPDQSDQTGMLDENGFARINGIDPGSCEVTFPDFNGADWKAA